MKTKKLVSFNLSSLTVDKQAVSRQVLQNMLLSRVASKVKHFSYDDYTTMYRRINHNNEHVRKEVK